MITYETIGDARNGIMDFRSEHMGGVPEHLRTRLRDLTASPSPVDQIVGVAEFIYANRDQLDAAAQEVGAGLTAFATTNAWHGLLDDDRGNRIVAVLRHEFGELKTAPAANATPDARPGSRIEPPEEPAGGSDS